jgi:hypothetical protein
VRAAIKILGGIEVMHCCVKEIRTAFDLECHFYREALIALDPRDPYDEMNIAVLHPKTRELVAMLREEG